MRKVLVVGLTSGIGGVETFIYSIKKYMNKKYENEILSNNSKIYKVTGIKENFLKYMKNIFDFYKNNNYDVVHLNECDSKMFLYALPLLFYRKPKLIVHCHSSKTNNILIHSILNFFQNKRADIKVACSNSAFEFMFGLKEEKNIVHNGVDLEEFKFSKISRLNKRKEFKVLENETLFISVARFTEEKNHEKIIDIFYNYNNIFKKSKLILIGIGPLQNKIKEKVNNLKISDKVLFLNTRTDISEIMSAADVFLLPSTFEGLPIVSIEAQACSLPFFASKNVSSEIAVTNLVHFIDLNESSKNWAIKINKILSKTIDRESDSFHDDIRKNEYDIKSVANKIEKMYRE